MSAAPQPVLLPRPGDPFSPWGLLKPAERHRAVHTWRKRTGVSWSVAAVVLYLFDRAAQKTECWPGLDLIAEDLALSENQTRRLLQQAERAGAIRIEHHGPQGNRYQILWHSAYTESLQSPPAQRKQGKLKPTTMLVDIEPKKTHQLDGRFAAAPPYKQNEVVEEKENQSTGAPGFNDRSGSLIDRFPQEKRAEKKPPQTSSAREAQEIAKAKSEFAPWEWGQVTAAVNSYEVVGKDTRDERPISVTPLLVARILLRSNGLTGNEVADYLADRRKYLDDRPHAWPRDEGWFVTIVDREFHKRVRGPEASLHILQPAALGRHESTTEEDDSKERDRILQELRDMEAQR